MAANRYRRESPPGARRYNNDPRSSTGMVFSSSFDPTYPRSTADSYPHTRHSSIYDTQPTKRYSIQQPYGPAVSATHYQVRPRTNSNVPSDGRRPLSTVVRNTSPVRTRPLVNHPAREDPRSPVLAPASTRSDTSKYLVPASSQGREHHQRHYSATRAEIERLNPPSRGSQRPRQEYHQTGGYSSKPYPVSRVKEDDYSYTGPREQFARDYPERPTERRDSQTRRERPASVYDMGGYKDVTGGRRDMGPPPAPSSRQLERVDKGADNRLSVRPAYEDDGDRNGDIPRRRHSMRAPVVHQGRGDDYREYSPRDEADVRPQPRLRRDRIEEEEIPVRPRKDRLDDDSLVSRRRDRTDEDAPPRPRKDRFGSDEDTVIRPRRDRTEDEETVSRPRPRETEREFVKERELPRERKADREYEREREKERSRPNEKDLRYSEDRRAPRSHEGSPEGTGHGKAVAAGLGGLAAAGLAGAALKGSQKHEDASDSESRRERKHRKHRRRGDDEEGESKDGDQGSGGRAPASFEADQESRRPSAKHDEDDFESVDDDHERRRHRRHRHKERDEVAIDAPAESRAADDAAKPEPNGLAVEDQSRRRRRHSRVREPEEVELERRISPGEDEDGRPRRVQLVEPVKDKDDQKPRGILKAPRTTPFPEDPNPTREGVAPLKDAGKDGVPPGARWTKISRMLVNPEALEKAHERFEERDDYVIVLRVITREEIEKLALKTKEIREEREREWQEELANRRAQEAHNPRPHSHAGTHHDDEEQRMLPPPMPDQVPLFAPANSGADARVYADGPSAVASQAPAMPVPDIKLEEVETSNYSTNV